MSEVEIYFLTGNKHKFFEVKPIAEKYGVKLVQYLGEKLEIQADDLVKIAKVAALNAYMNVGKPLLVEDAGLFIEALNGFPGPYSSYVFKTIGYTGILKLLENVKNRRAFFRSVAVLVYEPLIITGIGEVEGTIAYEARGDKGFGFDPIFIPRGSSKTFAEMSIEEKNMFSHRAKAVEKVFIKLKKLLEQAR